jgi:DNA-binding transcriptional LysR family regulator
MDLNKLRIFFTLAQTGNYSECAQKLFVTQSAVSHAIKRLESSIDLELIDRNQKGFALTPAGNTLFQSCRSIFFELEKTKELLLSARNYPEVIRLGTPVEFGLSIVLKQMKKFFDQHPNIHVDFRLSHNLLTPLLNDELDMVIDCRPHSNPELKVIPLFREEYAVIAANEYITENNIKKISDLSHCNILSIDKNLKWWGNFINALPLEEQGIFRRVTEINHIRGIINAAQSGIGIGFVPRYTVLKELEEGSLIELFPELDILKDHINIYIKRNRAELEKNKILIEYIKSFRLK